ncbi:WhiB family transcriptional regulator [Streptomyces sp. NPDC092046]|uniref:WhiB family transcriptional regulator n=1 Tax=Streptomyces sp. NPDC092046 TaxID=3366009 RepID=UPI003826EF2F
MVRTHDYAPTATQETVRPRPACDDSDPDLFFPIGNTGPALPQIEEAKAVCRACKSVAECLQGALDRDEQGVWGGLSEDERRALKRRAARNQPRTGKGTAA